MNKIDELLEYIHKTNPGMTRERLLEELSVSAYTSKAILFTDGICQKWSSKILSPHGSEF
jgi:orotate phosphoribosyltransferase-like protein